ncbi:hypothetical protein ASPWEDRAFT_108087 [Aspergillus wentii DTO 134E9]|uniref:Kinesin motor domain-containing protein n=1 Tax=Aspergillus wentii DTO 134E9 TaxID=1073089 RepID=A0A1L9RRC7_ASPWE|nr:uncharacterized protein ASPWEDRAFT_108087 [Aspergillus wentii DTO 134E9]OJJ37378.1 hypothetical protein ASPWEDRAFT_108087 [Aspergillus wentii DTO 134E9]
MTVSPPASPTGAPQRPISAIMRTPRSNSRLSMSSKHGGGSRASDEDAKTAVKVAVRVRPPLKPTDPGYELIPQRFQRSMVHVTAPTSLAVDVPQGRKLFVFDRVFPETVDQEGVWDYLNDSVNSFLQGYNVSILAYGQSGAGKSYTMGTSGPNEQNDNSNMGIIPRAAQLLFEQLDGPAKHNRNGSTGLRTPARYSMSSTSSLNRGSIDKSWQMKATYVEIYNEQLRDLLLPDSTPLGDRSTVTIREDAKGRIILTGLHQVNINSFEDLIGALNFGSSIRQTDSTAINAKSSRSHAVFSLNLVQHKPANATPLKDKRMSMPAEIGSDQSMTVDSKLHFVDLAGSERLKNTGASGERAREGISINAGLAALGKVISQLSSRQAGSHVSYRDSKLTRLLQDSLGGNAYTYMIACVTPAEFHLSETLNTVQYAQRARAIQSKPRIQQVADESDKHAVIDRLKAEVAFLRQQLRNAEDSDRRNAVPQERAERQNERENELQNQLLDFQESYNALSQRHAKLVSELARDSEQPNGSADDAASTVGKSSVERLKRSHSFAESVEQVVLEYEKTIQSLESSLSNTRSSLSVTESTLLERETKCAYVETVNAQMQSRIQKLLDREASTESYLHDLESRIDGQSSGEEKHAAIISELRKELNRARESEAGCEDYISTLEERLAEADQDMELMQREVNRLEHVVERQRSLGKLDNLLYDLDQVQQNGTKQSDKHDEFEQPVPIQSASNHRKRAMSLGVLTEAVETAIPESDEDLAEAAPVEGETLESELDHQAGSDLEVLEKVTSQLSPQRTEFSPENSAQSKFVADKLDTVSQELFDLRMQHEATVNDYESLGAKYEEALKALAELRQDAADEARHPAPEVEQLASPAPTSRPVSFLGDAKGVDAKTGAQPSFSQSLSSELSLAGESATSPVVSNGISEPKVPEGEEAGTQEIENMRKLLTEHQEGVAIMTQRYAELQSEHEDTLGLIESLKAELQTSKSSPSPTTPNFKSQVIRRKTSQSLMSSVDRAHRSIAAIRNIAVEQFAESPDTMQNLEVHLDSAMHELHSRMERIQSLEAENQSVKKEMEMKSTIISGLTRERSSLQGGAPSVDIGLVSQLRDQVVQQENMMNDLKESHDAREQVLLSEIESLTGLLKTQEAAAQANDVSSDEQEKRIGALEGELSEWKGKHQTAIDSLQSSEDQLNSTLAELDGALASVDATRYKLTPSGQTYGDREAASRKLEADLVKQHELVENLMQNIEEHKATIASQLEKISSLEQSHIAAQEQVSTEAGNASESVSGLEKEIESHKSLVESHKKDLESLQESHKRELVELESRTAAAAQAEYEARLAERNAEHDKAMETLRSEIVESREELVKLLKMVSGLLNSDVTADNLAEQLQDILTQKQHFSDKYAEMMDTNEDLRKKLELSGGDNSALEELNQKNTAHAEKVSELALLVATMEDTVRSKDDQIKKKEALVEEITAEKDKSLRLVEELEDQITNSFDQHHNRLSVIQQERDQALEDAKAKIATYEDDIETYHMRIEQLELQIKNSGGQDSSHDRSSSLTSNLRKSSSATSLPSPPPAIPLPPLPSIASATNGNSGSISPPSSRHTSKELVNAQIVEDQEARIRTIEKHLYAEKQLTATLEEALGDLEAQSNKVKSDCEAWKKKAWQLEDELGTLRKERNSQRLSLQAVEEERSARREAEAARAQLEERMNALNKKKKKSTLNCF